MEVWERVIVWIIAAIVIALLITFLYTQFVGDGGVAALFKGSFNQGNQMIDQVG